MKIIILLAPARLGCTKTNKNEVGTKDSNDIDSSKIDNRIANLLNITKKKKRFERTFLSPRLV